MICQKENKAYLIYSDAYLLCPSMCVVLIVSASVSDFLFLRECRFLISAISCYTVFMSGAPSSALEIRRPPFDIDTPLWLL